MDVAIVGGGIVGCAAAAYLAEGGARVTLLEAAEIGAGASGRNSGAVQHPFDPVLADLHRETLELFRALDGFPLPPAPAGLLLLTDDPPAAAARTLELATSFPELRPELLDPADLAREEPMLARGLSAIRLETGYPVAPEAAVQAFARQAREAGATLQVGVDVVGIDVRDGVVRGVRRSDGTSQRADAVLVAAGPWTTTLLDPSGSWRPIGRTWGVTVQVRMARPPHHVLEEGLVHTINRTVERRSAASAPGPAVESIFSMVSVGGTSTVGSTFIADEPDPGVVGPLLVDRGSALLPALGGAKVLRHRRCARPQSVDGRPMVGRLGDVAGLIVCAGHGPWGISTGPATARMAADLVLGRDAAIPDELEPARLGNPWGPAAGRA